MLSVSCDSYAFGKRLKIEGETENKRVSKIIKYIAIVIFIISLFIIFWGMIGYQVSLKIIKRIAVRKPLKKESSAKPTVTVMVVAHNEEKVIRAKLENLLTLDYPSSRIEFLVTSDNSDDHTNEIVTEFIQAHLERNIRLYVTKEHMGKTNAQNEAQKQFLAIF